jgi:hypothetical protein
MKYCICGFRFNIDTTKNAKLKTADIIKIITTLEKTVWIISNIEGAITSVKFPNRASNKTTKSNILLTLIEIDCL